MSYSLPAVADFFFFSFVAFVDHQSTPSWSCSCVLYWPMIVTSIVGFVCYFCLMFWACLQIRQRMFSVLSFRGPVQCYELGVQLLAPLKTSHKAPLLYSQRSNLFRARVLNSNFKIFLKKIMLFQYNCKYFLFIKFELYLLFLFYQKCVI